LQSVILGSAYRRAATVMRGQRSSQRYLVSPIRVRLSILCVRLLVLHYSDFPAEAADHSACSVLSCARACAVEPSYSKQASKLKVRQDIGDGALLAGRLSFSLFNRSCACMDWFCVTRACARAGRLWCRGCYYLPLLATAVSVGRANYMSVCVCTWTSA